MSFTTNMLLKKKRVTNLVTDTEVVKKKHTKNVLIKSHIPTDERFNSLGGERERLPEDCRRVVVVL